MRFKDVFSIIGPGMIGPSSSHTAGAVRLGRVARQLLGAVPEQADITFYGSFADTYAGHGTDVAVVGGLLDFDTDDERIPDALRHAQEYGMRYRFVRGRTAKAHPNTAKISVRACGRECVLTGSSIGGGNIEVTGIDDFDVEFTAGYPTLLVFHGDRPGMIADITGILGQASINIGYMDVDRKGRNGEALTVIEADNAFPPDVVERIRALPRVGDVRIVDLGGGAGI